MSGYIDYMPGGTRVREYHFRRHILFFLVIGYVFASLYGPRLGRSEFYPFFNWDLFSYPHSIQYDVVVLVHSINDVDLKEPTIYFYIPNTFDQTQGDKVRLNKLLRDLWRYHGKGNRKRVEMFLNIIRKQYFSGVGAALKENAIIKYDPMVRLKTGKFEILRTIVKISK